jgi:mRNA interferase MazF
MQKDFNGWNSEKQRIDKNKSDRFCHPREIWWCALGVNVGFEQDGTGKNFDRPVIIIKGFNENVFIGVALTGRRKQGKYYFPIGIVEGREASVILSQVRILDAKRLVRKMGTLDEAKFVQLKSALWRTLFE